MSSCKTLVRASLASLQTIPHFHLTHLSTLSLRPLSPLSVLSPKSSCIKTNTLRVRLRTFSSVQTTVVSAEPATELIEDYPEDSTRDTVENLLKSRDDVAKSMKMERRSTISDENTGSSSKRWFPYLDSFRCGDVQLNSAQVLEVMSPYIMEERKEKFQRVVSNRSFSVCLVVEGLHDFGNVSAAFRSADAFGVQSVHVVSCRNSNRYRENRHVSKGAEKWLDIELWDSPKECFEALRSRGYRIATTHLGTDTVSIHDMDWSCPTAIVVGNETRGISDEALQLSDLSCSIPMNGMVDSFNVSVASGILMHHAVCDRTSRLGHHSDLTAEERQILLAEFSLRHNKNSASIAYEYGKQNGSLHISKL